MKRSFDPNEVIDLTQGEENESNKIQAKKPKRDRGNVRIKLSRIN